MASDQARQMALVGFMQAGSTSVYTGSWRHPATEHGFLTAGYYQKLARILEDGCFDLMFFDDRLAMPGIYGGSVAEAVRTGARPVKLDLSVVLGIVAGVTQHIGLGATYSTTYYSPYHVARTFATLDHLSGGRAAWNIVTSVNDSEAQNFGVDAVLGHDARYDRADEFLEATTGLWDTWDDDALVLDREGGVFAKPESVQELDYEGEWFKVRGPLTVPRGPQGRPVLLQAGSSGRGRDFASRWAEVIFTGDPDIDIARSHYKDQKERIAEDGRDPAVREDAADGVRGRRRDAGPGAGPRTAPPQRPRGPDGVADAPVRAHELRLLRHRPRRAHHRRADRVGQRHPRPRAEHPSAHRRATPSRSPTWPATAPPCSRAPASSAPGPTSPTRWRSGSSTEACDGFVLAATHCPGAYEDVVRMVVPELQRRGVFRERYTGATLRENLGLERPASTLSLSSDRSWRQR